MAIKPGESSSNRPLSDDLIIKVKFLTFKECDLPIPYGYETKPTLPSRSYEGDLGFDLTLSQDIAIPPHEVGRAHTQIALELPKGWGGLVRDRSSGPYKNSVAVLGGVFDNGYRGEVQVTLLNFSNQWVHLEPGIRIAQIVPIPIFLGEIRLVEELSPSDRGTRGHGSTGR